MKIGENVTLMAPSGYGKTTLMGILAGIDTDFLGMVTTKALQQGIVFQEPGLFWYKTVKENILYSLKTQKIPWCRDKQQHYQEWMAVTGLAGFENHYPHEISRGMKQKSAIIRAFLAHPDLVFMDEPFSAIDKASTQEIIDHIHAEYPETTLVVASHSLGEAARFSDRVLTATHTPISGFEIS
nr:ATP-binding cassette domain-containing protein [Desulfobacula sp.]